MSPRIQSIVNAQVEVNRAVFEGNKPLPDEAYISARLEAARDDLRVAIKYGKRRLRGKEKRKK